MRDDLKLWGKLLFKAGPKRARVQFKAQEYFKRPGALKAFRGMLCGALLANLASLNLAALLCTLILLPLLIKAGRQALQQLKEDEISYARTRSASLSVTALDTALIALSSLKAGHELKTTELVITLNQILQSPFYGDDSALIFKVQESPAFCQLPEPDDFASGGRYQALAWLLEDTAAPGQNPEASVMSPGPKIFPDGGRAGLGRVDLHATLKGSGSSSAHTHLGAGHDLPYSDKMGEGPCHGDLSFNSPGPQDHIRSMEGEPEPDPAKSRAPAAGMAQTCDHAPLPQDHATAQSFEERAAPDPKPGNAQNRAQDQGCDPGLKEQAPSASLDPSCVYYLPLPPPMYPASCMPFYLKEPLSHDDRQSVRTVLLQERLKRNLDLNAIESFDLNTLIDGTLSFKALAQEIKALRSNYVYLGTAFPWQGIMTSQYLKLCDLDPRLDPNLKGSALLNFLGEGLSQNLCIKCSDLSEHAVIFGSSGSGKTKLLTLIIVQAIRRGDCVIIIDPKADAELMQITEAASVLCGRQRDFALFDPSNLKGSSGYNPVGHYQNYNDIAERLTAAMPSDGSSASFKNHCFSAVSAACALLELEGQSFTLDKIAAKTSSLSALKEGLFGVLEKMVLGIEDEKKRKEALVYASKVLPSLKEKPALNEEAEDEEGSKPAGEDQGTGAATAPGKRLRERPGQPLPA